MRSSETSAHIRTTRRCIQEDGIFHNYRSENLELTSMYARRWLRAEKLKLQRRSEAGKRDEFRGYMSESLVSARRTHRHKLQINLVLCTIDELLISFVHRSQVPFAFSLSSPRCNLFLLTVLHVHLAMSVLRDVEGGDIILTRCQQFSSEAFLMEDDSMVDRSPF
jgi:hypothetical protein